MTDVTRVGLFTFRLSIAVHVLWVPFTDHFRPDVESDNTALVALSSSLDMLRCLATEIVENIGAGRCRCCARSSWESQQHGDVDQHAACPTLIGVQAKLSVSRCTCMSRCFANKATLSQLVCALYERMFAGTPRVLNPSRAISLPQYSTS